MRGKVGLSRFLCSLFAVLFSTAAFAQFTSSVQGVVQDPSGASVAKATVQIVNRDTQFTQTTTTDADGNFRFLSLAPGAYKITVEMTGFTKSEADVTLLTEQNLSVPISLKVGSTSEAVTVTSEIPVVDTADSRTSMRASELLPHPDSPTMESVVPRSSSNEISLTACTRP